MKVKIYHWLLLMSLSSTFASKDADLPPCPTNLQYFPQNLPMHCRMPGNPQPASFQGNAMSDNEMPQQFATIPPLPPPFYQSPPPNKQPNPIPIPIPPFPGMPGGMSMPGPMGGPMGPPMPGMPPMPGGMPMPMPMPMPMVGGPPHKLPVIVMPFYSPDNSFKRPPNHRPPKTKPPRKKKKSYDSDTDTSSEDTSSGGTSAQSDSSDEHGFWKGHRRSNRRKMTRRFNKRHKSKRKREKKRKDLLTPILQYVTKDGYVIFEKQISKNEAKDWLKPKEVNVVEEVKNENNNNYNFEVAQKEKSAEAAPKTEIEDLVMKPEEKSKEEETESKPSTPKIRKHRSRKVSNLINQPSPEPDV